MDMPMLPQSPHARYQHLYVVLRVDDFSSVNLAEDRVATVSAYLSITKAEAEVARLNALAGKKRCRYVVLTTRLKDGPAIESAPDG